MITRSCDLSTAGASCDSGIEIVGVRCFCASLPLQLKHLVGRVELGVPGEELTDVFLTPIFQEIAGGGFPLFVSAEQLIAA